MAKKTFVAEVTFQQFLFVLIHMEQQSTSQSEYLPFSFSSDFFTYQLDFSVLTLEGVHLT